GADVVFCQKGIDDLAQHYLAKAGILAFRRVKKSDLSKLAKATGASVVSKLDDLEADDLGFAGLVEQRHIGEDERFFVEDCQHPESVSLLLRGGTEHVVEEVERSITDALEVVRVTIEDGQVLPGGGAPEAELALSLRDFADSVGGREQLAVEAFADAIEVVPRTLATNAGLDPIDTLVELRAAHDAGETAAGLSTIEKAVADMLDEGVVEPLRVKTQAIASAQEATDLILRIDDVIAAGDLSSSGDDMDEFDDF
ncbi:MAG: TCP-1/cpn60 chaperonin family protein, partial [Halobacteriales archaeon]